MKIKKLIITGLLCMIFAFTAFGITAFADELDNENAFTPGGVATVIDNVLEQNGKEFFTIRTEAGNIFYLVVDRMRAGDNVYFLNAVTEQDLLALAERAGNPVTSTPDLESEQSPEQPQQPNNNGNTPPTQNADDNDMTTYIFIGAAVVIVGGVGFYFKIIKKKRGNDDSEYEDYDDDDNYDTSTDDDTDNDDEPDDEM